MKLNKIALAVIATASVSATAGVTVSPLLLGYHYTDEAHDEQRKVLQVGKQLNTGSTSGGVATESGLYTGAALGIELTPATQLQVEYGVSNTDAKASDYSASLSGQNRFDAEQQTISGNLLVGIDQFTGNYGGKFKPYVLVGAGQSKIKVENKEAYNVGSAATATTVNTAAAYYPAGSQVTSSTDTIGNVGLGARYLVNDALALRGEARAIHNFDNNWWEGLALAGLEVTLGGRLAPAVSAPPVVDPVVPPTVVEVEEQPAAVDSDMDGVLDEFDACPNTPRNLVVDARGCPVEVNIVENLQQELRVFFDNDKSTIKPQFRQEIAKVAETMREVPNATAVIEGHASKTGPSAKYNKRLSEARANAVKSMLSNEFGVDASRLTAVGYGYDRPIAPNNTEEGRAQNRRVYAVIKGSTTQTVQQTKDMQ